MGNLVEEFYKGQNGANKGLPMGVGVSQISSYINGVQKGRYYGVAAPPKCGKSTFVNYAFLIQPYLYAVKNNIDVEWIYFSFEIKRVELEFDVAAHFIHEVYNVERIKLEDGVTKDGKNNIPFDTNYLRGRVLDDNGELIKVKPKVIEYLKSVYKTYIIPMFGKYDIVGRQLEKGKVTVISDKDNPTGLYNYLIDHAKQYGEFFKSEVKTNNRNTIYVPNNNKKFIIVIVDHMRKLKTERDYNLKGTIDKFSDMCCDIRDMCNYTFVNIIHTNRSIITPERIRASKDMLYPTPDDVKDTGNMAEDCDYFFTMFNPNDDTYRLKRHFGIELRDKDNVPLYPNLRTLHLVQSRHGGFPKHFKTEMLGSVKTFRQINI